MTLPSWQWWRTAFVLIPLVSLYTIVFGVLSLVSGIVDRRGRLAHRCARVWARVILRTVGVRVRVHGDWPVTGLTSAVYISNHQSIFDIPVVFATIPAQLRVLAKAMLGGIPFIGWHLRRAGHVLVDRANPGPSVVRKMQQLVESGASLVVFPEGTRSDDGRVGPFKPGVFAIAVDRQLPIIPITLSGTRHVMRKGHLTARSGVVDVIVHAPISTVGLTRDDVAGVTALARAAVTGSSVHGSSVRNPAPGTKDPGSPAPGTAP